MKASQATVVLDACVLVPMPLAGTLLRLAATGMYSPRWSREILLEVARTLERKFGLTAEQVGRWEAALHRHFPDSGVAGHEALIPLMRNREGDRHVLAAALHGGAKLIVTANLRHFPSHVLAPFGVEAVNADQFLMGLYQQWPQAVLLVLFDSRSPFRVALVFLVKQ